VHLTVEDDDDHDDHDDDDDDDDDDERGSSRKKKKERREFRISKTPSRDELAWKLEAEYQKKSKVLKSTPSSTRRASTSRRTPTPMRSPATPSLSAAAQRLLRRAGGANSELRASYGSPLVTSGFRKPTPRAPTGSSSKLRPSPSPLRP
jgi:hypothetical protein